MLENQYFICFCLCLFDKINAFAPQNDAYRLAIYILLLNNSNGTNYLPQIGCINLKVCI